MRVVVDWDLCESNGLCVLAAPEVFKLLDNDNLDILQEEPDESQRGKLEEAVRNCPKRAISLQ